MKKCAVCKKKKEKTANFSKQAASKDGFHSRCKQCDSERNKKRYQTNPEYFVKQATEHKARRLNRLDTLEQRIIKLEALIK